MARREALMQPGRVPFAAWPSEPIAWIALALGVAAFALVPLLASRSVRPRLWVIGWAACACLLSAAYVHAYLHGGPRIIDASSYWLEARAIAEGQLSWPILEPTASFRGRFLLPRWSSDAASLGVIFPPGYPAVLALGFLAGAPMAVGPVIAALLVVATAALARAVSQRDDVAMVAAVMSALCSALRYHTADTMSHGVAALALATSLVCGWAAHDTPSRRKRTALLVAAGLAFGLLAATRPVSAFAAFCVALPFALAAQARPSWRDFSWLAVGASAPLLLLAFHQLSVTGHLLASSQRAYYELADGPPGCFRYGFGRGIGCLVEHGTYVHDLLPDGYGFFQAARTTGRRLVLHVEDVLNLPMAVVLVPIGVWVARTRRRGWMLGAMVASQILVYAPFYFDGNYPGGGARMFADAIPVEHALAAVAVCAWADRLKTPLRFAWASALVACTMLTGFAFFNAPKHAALRDRDGGRPFFEPGVVQEAGVSRGLLFVDSDHGFNTAFDPAVRSAHDGLLVARARHDDHDRLLWELQGRPDAWTYRWAPWADAPSPPRLEPWSAPTAVSGHWVFEAEAEWPPVDQRDGYAAPTWLAPGSCVSGGIALALTRIGDQQACVTIDVPIPGPGDWDVTPWLVMDGDAVVQAWLGDGSKRVPWPLPPSLAPATTASARRSEADGRWCVSLGKLRVASESAGRRTWTMCTGASWIAVDRVEVDQPRATSGER